VFCPRTQLMQVVHPYNGTNTMSLNYKPPSSILVVRLEMAVSSVTPLPLPSPHPLPLCENCSLEKTYHRKEHAISCMQLTWVVGLYLTIIRYNPAACNTLCSPAEGRPPVAPYSSRHCRLRKQHMHNASSALKS
jgi:hypothetical protein